jgi:hypothetical protein
MADDWYPDIVVGVDFGMTCTGAIAQNPLLFPPLFLSANQL